LPKRNTRHPPSGSRPHSIAGSPDGCTEAILLAHGFPIGLLVKLIDAGLATAHAERMMVGGRPMEVTRLRITHAGRRAIAWRAK
jgi:hypothetical protein